MCARASRAAVAVRRARPAPEDLLRAIIVAMLRAGETAASSRTPYCAWPSSSKLRISCAARSRRHDLPGGGEHHRAVRLHGDAPVHHPVFAGCSRSSNGKMPTLTADTIAFSHFVPAGGISCLAVVRVAFGFRPMEELQERPPGMDACASRRRSMIGLESSEDLTARWARTLSSTDDRGRPMLERST